MLYLANKTDKKVYEKNLDDFLQSPMGADSGKCFIDIEEKKIARAHEGTTSGNVTFWHHAMTHKFV